MASPVMPTTPERPFQTRPPALQYNSRKRKSIKTPIRLFENGVKLIYEHEGYDPEITTYNYGSNPKEKPKKSPKPPVYQGQKGPQPDVEKMVGYWIPDPNLEEGPGSGQSPGRKTMVVPEHSDFPTYGGFEIGPDDEHLTYYGPGFWALPKSK